MPMTNRYPRNEAARDFRRQPPVERRYPTPANDNNPRGPRLRPRTPLPLIPANDNRPVPKVGDWSRPRMPRIPGWARWLSRFMRLYPLIGAALTLYELYELYQWYQSQTAPADYSFCSSPMPNHPLRATSWTFIPAQCTNFTGPSGQPNWQPGAPWYNTWQGRNLAPPFVGQRWLRMEAFRYDTDPGSNPLQPRTVPYIQPYVDPDYPGTHDDPFPDPLKPTDPVPRPKKPLNPTPRDRPRHRDDPRLPPRPRLPEDRVSDEPTFEPRPEWRTRPLPRPPRKRERERKIRIRDMPNERLRRTLGWLLSAASEGGDFLDIMYDALPGELQNDNANMLEKFETVFQNLDKVDFDKFVSDLWQNQVSDRYFGKGFGDMSEALEEFGLELPTLRL